MKYERQPSSLACYQLRAITQTLTLTYVLGSFVRFTRNVGKIKIIQRIVSYQKRCKEVSEDWHCLEIVFKGFWEYQDHLETILEDFVNIKVIWRSPWRLLTDTLVHNRWYIRTILGIVFYQNLFKQVSGITRVGRPKNSPWGGSFASSCRLGFHGLLSLISCKFIPMWN